MGKLRFLAPFCLASPSLATFYDTLLKDLGVYLLDSRLSMTGERRE